MDKRKIIAEIVAKTGMKIDEDDPAFLLVELNLLMLENSNNQAVKNLEESTKNFGEIYTRNIDDFVSVSNEALSKFIQRTNELKDTINKLQLESTPQQIVKNKFLWWLIPFIFSFGLLSGVVLTNIISK